MKSSWLWFEIWLLGLGISVLAVGCGQQAAQETVSTPTPTTSTVTISGSLYTVKGLIASSVTITSAGVKILATADAPIENYQVVAVGKEDGKVYFSDSKTATSGAFTISNLPSGEAFYLEILDSTNKLVAPISMGTTGASSGKTIMAVTPEGQATLNLGKIAFSSSEGTAVPTVEPTAYLEEDATANVKSGKNLIPVGAGNFGKGEEAKISGATYVSTKVDGDLDGLPNFFDADNNGDGSLDELDGLYTMEAIGAVGLSNFYPSVFTNLKVEFSQRTNFKTNYPTFDIAVGVTGASTSTDKKSLSTKSIQSVRVTEGPGWLTKATIEAGSPWSISNYNVPLKYSTPQPIYEIHLKNLKPGSEVTAGDILKFLVTYSDGTSEEAIKMINFVFTDIPQVTAYKIGSAGSWQTASSFPVSASSSEVHLRWTRPKDEADREIMGGRYTFEYNVTGETVSEIEVINKDSNPYLTSLEASCNFLSLPNANLLQEPLILGVCIRSAANDNAAENVWFSRSGW